MTEYLAVTSTLEKTTSKYFFLKHYRDFENVYRKNRESGAYQKESHCRYGSHCPQHRPVNSDFAFDRSVAAVRQLRLNAQTFYAKLQSRTRFLRQGLSPQLATRFLRGPCLLFWLARHQMSLMRFLELPFQLRNI